MVCGVMFILLLWLMFSHILFAMSTKRASFTPDIVTILLAILPEHVTPAGGKVDWDNVANILNTRTGKTFSAVSVKNWFSSMKEKHKAWKELKRWTGLGWGPNNCPQVDLQSEKWLAFSKVLVEYSSLLNFYNVHICFLFQLMHLFETTSFFRNIKPTEDPFLGLHSRMSKNGITF